MKLASTIVTISSAALIIFGGHKLIKLQGENNDLRLENNRIGEMYLGQVVENAKEYIKRSNLKEEIRILVKQNEKETELARQAVAKANKLVVISDELRKELSGSQAEANAYNEKAKSLAKMLSVVTNQCVAPATEKFTYDLGNIRSLQQILPDVALSLGAFNDRGEQIPEHVEKRTGPVAGVGSSPERNTDDPPAKLSGFANKL